MNSPKKKIKYTKYDNLPTIWYYLNKFTYTDAPMKRLPSKSYLLHIMQCIRLVLFYLLESWFLIPENWFSVPDNRFSVPENRFSFLENRFSVQENRFTCVASRYLCLEKRFMCLEYNTPTTLCNSWFSGCSGSCSSSRSSSCSFVCQIFELQQLLQSTKL